MTCVPIAHAQTLWTGPNINFTQTTHSSSDSDVIVAGKVALSRGTSKWLFNTAADQTSASTSSPSDTMWAFGSISDFSTLSYSTFASLRNGDLAGVILNKPMVVHLVNENIYLSLTFTAWGQHGDGGFAYTRSTAPAAPPTPTVSITSPSNGAAFTAPANVAMTVSASVSSGTITNVAFFAGTNLLGSNQTAPFNFTALNLAAGDYSLIAVATAAGISATSSVVSITVEPPAAPAVSITNPVGAAVFAAPANVAIAADATVSSGIVTNVTFYNGAAVLGSVTNSPFGIIASNLAASAYALTAVATAAGISTTSAVVNISVVSPVVVSNSLPAISGGQFSFSYTANPGLTYIVEGSSNLLNWVPLATNVASSGSVNFTDTSGLTAQGFYEVVLQPNP
jgi:hypothetical protein